MVTFYVYLWVRKVQVTLVPPAKRGDRHVIGTNVFARLHSAGAERIYLLDYIAPELGAEVCINQETSGTKTIRTFMEQHLRFEVEWCGTYSAPEYLP
jgi:hypothetical protein